MNLSFSIPDNCINLEKWFTLLEELKVSQCEVTIHYDMPEDEEYGKCTIELFERNKAKLIKISKEYGHIDFTSVDDKGTMFEEIKDSEEKTTVIGDFETYKSLVKLNVKNQEECKARKLSKESTSEEQ